MENCVLDCCLFCMNCSVDPDDCSTGFCSVYGYDVDVDGDACGCFNSIYDAASGGNSV